MCPSQLCLYVSGGSLALLWDGSIRPRSGLQSPKGSRRGGGGALQQVTPPSGMMVLIVREEVTGRIWDRSMRFPSLGLLGNSHFGTGMYNHTDGVTFIWFPSSFICFTIKNTLLPLHTHFSKGLTARPPLPLPPSVIKDPLMWHTKYRSSSL